MSIRPVDFKTTLYNAEDVSRTAENQKNHDAGVDGHITQNRNETIQKNETVQNTQNAEGQIIKQDENGRGNQQNNQRRQQQKKEEEKKIIHPDIPDGIHGHFDFRA